MAEDRLASLKRLVEARPEDPRGRFGLALEYERLQRWQDAAEELRLYLAMTSDEGNAYGRLARALLRLGREEEAREAYRQGIEAANRHGHPTMAGEFEDALDEL